MILLHEWILNKNNRWTNGYDMRVRLSWNPNDWKNLLYSSKRQIFPPCIPHPARRIIYLKEQNEEDFYDNSRKILMIQYALEETWSITFGTLWEVIFI